jgi:hypothetical protein
MPWSRSPWMSFHLDGRDRLGPRPFGDFWPRIDEDGSEDPCCAIRRQARRHGSAFGTATVI